MRRTFEFDGKVYGHFDHPYNTTIRNERAVEVPIVWEWLTVQADGGELLGPRVLEVGNVLQHYVDVSPVPERRIVDRFEVADGVENLDVFDIAGEYDLIVSISTIEHVGNEATNGPIVATLAAEAIVHLTNLLVPGGRMLLTIPTGYHQALDLSLRFMTFSGYAEAAWRISTMVREPVGWHQTDEPDVRQYGRPFPCANAVWIVEFQRPA